jgi:hypothetical protein
LVEYFSKYFAVIKQLSEIIYSPSPGTTSLLVFKTFSRGVRKG